MTEFDKPKLLHELDKVIKTLDYIEKTCKETERSLEKQLLKGKNGL
jgi:chaperonin cofactor prefoldin